MSSYNQQIYRLIKDMMEISGVFTTNYGDSKGMWSALFAQYGEVPIGMTVLEELFPGNSEE